MFAHALAIFLGAFLLFQVQPLIGKYILPWFGGGPGVWTTCMLFFQVVLLAGYAYAHWLTRFCRIRTQLILHGTLLLAALVTLPIIPADSWKPDDGINPVGQILLLLAACLGLPYFTLSSTGPLVQQWFSRTHPGVSPYRLYALSNLGSLLALVSYPLWVETQFTRLVQAKLWSFGFVAFVASLAWCGSKLWRNTSDLESDQARGATEDETGADSRATLVQRGLWLLLPACASTLLLATTNKLCQDVAVIPFLWVLPLAIYLGSFILCFDNPRWYSRAVFIPALIVALPAVCWALFEETDLELRWQALIYTGALFVCCMVCHGELYRLRPNPRHLTGFYLMIATGGALGGMFVAAAAPVIFNDYYEMHWALLLCGLLFIVVCVREETSAAPNQWRWLAGLLALAFFAGVDRVLAWVGQRYSELFASLTPLLRLAWWSVLLVMVTLWLARGQHRKFRYWRGLACCWLILAWCGLAVALWLEARHSDKNVITRSRNFYGTLKVCEYRKDEPESHYLLLEHGRITHGLQFVNRDYAKWPTSYYGDGSGIALGVAALPSGPRRIGVVGLGTGTMAIFGRAGDYLRLYEINPEVLAVARSNFTYLQDCPARVDIALGDARLSLDQEPPQQFDLLALDAFSSDAIPIHLLTREAFEIYLRHVKTNGVIAVHISNRYLDLEPVARNLARHFDLKLAKIDFEEHDDEEAEWWLYASTWVLLTRNVELLNRPEIRNATGAANTNAPAIPLWTDDFASILQVLD